MDRTSCIEEIYSVEQIETPTWDKLSRAWVKVKCRVNANGHVYDMTNVYTAEEFGGIVKCIAES